jgi:O-antigen/teichoic acid export membrane protein
VKRDLYIILAGRFLQVITSIFVLRLMTARLSPAEMGKYALIMSFVSFFALIFINPIGMYINRKLNDWYGRGLVWYRFWQGLQYLCLVVLVSLTLILVIDYCVGLKSQFSLYWLLVLVGGSLMFNTLNQTIIPSFNMLGKRREWVIFTLVTLWGGLGASMIATAKDGRAESWIGGQLFGMLLGIVLAIVPFRRLLKKCEESSNDYHWNLNAIKSVLHFTLPVALTVCLSWVQFQSYRFFVSELSGMEYLGLFVAGYTISAGIMSAFETTAINYFYPIFYNRINNADDKEKAYAWKKYAVVMLPLTLYIAVFIIVMSQQLTHILVSEAFWFAADFVVFGALAEAGRIIGNVYSLMAHAKMNTKVLILPQLIGALTAVLLVPVLALQLPMSGVGIALATSSTLYVLSIHFFMRKYFAITLSFRDLFCKALLAVPISAGWLLSLLVGSNYFADIISLVLSGMVYILVSYLVLRRSSTYETEIHT